MAVVSEWRPGSREGKSSGAVVISLKTVHDKRLAAEFAAPLRDLTVRETHSRGPDSASVRMRRSARSVAEQSLATASTALLPTERVRTTVCAFASTSPLLQCPMSSRSSALASLASLPELSRQRSGPNTAARAVASLSRAVAWTAGGSADRTVGRGGDGPGRAARGPAPSAEGRRILLRSPRLL